MAIVADSIAASPQHKFYLENVFGHYHVYYHFYKFIYLFLAALGLHRCTWAFSSCSERELLFVAVRGLLIAAASLVAEHGL